MCILYKNFSGFEGWILQSAEEYEYRWLIQELQKVVQLKHKNLY